MPMFEEFDNNITEESHIPECLHTNTGECKPLVPRRPYEMYDAAGCFIGYYWYYGDTINLEFTINGEILDESSGLYISAEDFVRDKFILVDIVDSKHNVVLDKTFDGATTISFLIDKEESEKLIRGVYFINLKIIDNEQLRMTLFSSDDMSITVK